MLVDISQTKSSVVVSYFDEDQMIHTTSYNVAKHTNNYGFYDYEICDESDPAVEPELRHYKGQRIKKVPPTNKSRNFEPEELREFVNHTLPRDERKKIFRFVDPLGFAVDIELDIRDKEDDAFPDPYEAKYKVCSIQITAPNLNTITATKDHDRINPEVDDPIIEDKINNYFKNTRKVWEITDRIKYKTIVLESEAELLRWFFGKVRDSLHFCFFWNGDGFDVPYLSTRCKKLGINLGDFSPTGEATHVWGKNIDWWPKHRYVEDYLEVTSLSAFDIWPRESMALDWIANYIFKIGKVPYDGTFYDLYTGDYKRFLFYGAVDTILTQLIHIEKNYLSSLLATAYYCKIPIKSVWKTTAMCHAVIWDDLYDQNLINAVPFVRGIKTPYGGGFVKEPVEKFTQYPIGSDYSALYPRTMISHGMSFESYVKRAESKEEAKKYLDEGYYVSVNGNIYKNDKDYTIRRVEEKLTKERGIYKSMYREIKDKMLPLLEAEMKKRGLKLDNKKIVI